MSSTAASPTYLAASGVDVGGALSDTLRSVLLFVPRLLLFAVILVAGWLIARVLLTVVGKLLDRVGFDRAVERGGLDRLLSNSPWHASDIAKRLVYWAALLVTAQLAFGVWGPNPASDLIAAVLGWLPRAAVALVILVVAGAAARTVKDFAAAALGGLSYGRALAAGASWLIIGVGAIAALTQVGVASTVTTPLLIAVLATIGGVLVVGAGGGLIRPMQHRWEMILNRVERDSEGIADRSWAYAAGRHAAATAMDDEQAPAFADAHSAGAGALFPDNHAAGSGSLFADPHAAAAGYAGADGPSAGSPFAGAPVATPLYRGGGPSPVTYSANLPEHGDYPGATAASYADDAPTEPLPAVVDLSPAPAPDPNRSVPPRFGDGSSAPMS